MITKPYFISQREHLLHKKIQNSACGVCCLMMVIYQQKGLKINKDGVNKMFASIVAKHSDSKEAVKTKFNFSDELSIEITQKLKENGKTLNQQFYPVFTLQNGYDHRASKLILEENGLTGDLVQDDLKNILERMAQGSTKYFLASIHSFLGRGRHVVIIHKKGIDKTGEYIEVIDPWERTYPESIKRFDIPFFTKIFNGYGTEIY